MVLNMEKRKALISSLIFALFCSCSLVACSSDETAGGSTEATNGFAERDSMVVAAHIDGFIQKGPFVENSPVKVWELHADGTRTGRFFETQTDEKGGFSIDCDSLVSKYVDIESEGSFRSEIPGQNYGDPVTLRAFGIASTTSSINVNVFTQLQYNRVAHLVEKDSLSITMAKDSAKGEVERTLFGKTSDVPFEKLNIFGSTESDGRLLAFSVLMLNNKTSVEFNKTLSSLSYDLADGVNNDVKLVQEIQKNAEENAIDYAGIQENMKSWGISDVVPEIQKYADQFMTMDFSSPVCDGSEEGSLKEMTYKEHSHLFACRDGEWILTYLNPEFEYGTFTDSRDGFIYRTTEINGQVWMAENLHYRPDSLPDIACYDDDEYYCDVYGMYYNPEEANKVCPSGWHLPSDEEWNALFNFVSDSLTAGTYLRAKNAWDVSLYPEADGAMDDYGFSAAPAGVYVFGDEGKVGFFHSATNGYNDVAVVETANIYYSTVGDATRIPLRCLKDN